MMITLALAKGRMQTDALDLLAQAGFVISESELNSRKLAIFDESEQLRLIFVKPADVPVYVEYGIADCGVVGRDVLLEAKADLLQPLDLKIAFCRICVAAKKGEKISAIGARRVATKYPRIASDFFGAKGVPIEIIELSGSVELAPILGLADCIVDLVETGKTLKENGLEVVEEITTTTGKLVVNRASYHLKSQEIADLIAKLRKVLEKYNVDKT